MIRLRSFFVFEKQETDFLDFISKRRFKNKKNVVIADVRSYNKLIETNNSSFINKRKHYEQKRFSLDRSNESGNYR